MSLEFEQITPADLELGESPGWDARDAALLHVDINAGLVLSWSPATRRRALIRRFAPPLGFVLPRAPGGYVVGQARTVWLVDGLGCRPLLSVDVAETNLRFNDARCDASGRLWAGTMALDRAPGVAGLHRIDPDGAVERVLSGLTISNGIGWSPDGTTCFHVDSLTQRIDAYDFDCDRGTLGQRRPFAAIDPADGLPDGLAVDVDGGVWIALFGGGQVRRYDAAGGLDQVLELPVTNCTCPAFGGEELADLYVSSAKHRLSEEERAAQPLAGALFASRPGVRGLPTHGFAG